ERGTRLSPFYLLAYSTAGRMQRAADLVGAPAVGAVQRYKELRLGQLRAFCAVVQHRSFSAAARALHLSHPVVWQQVRALERDFGGSILERRGRTIEPTAEGRVLFELASSIVASMDSLHERFDDRCGAIPRKLVVAGSASVFAQDLAPVVVAFCQQHPQ